MCACLALELYSSAPLERFVCSPSVQFGAGLSVEGAANLNRCQVYDNQATVRAPVPGLTSSAPLERFVCSPSA